MIVEAPKKLHISDIRKRFLIYRGFEKHRDCILVRKKVFNFKRGENEFNV